MRHYRFGADGSFHIEDRFFNAEDRMVKLQLPVAFTVAACLAEACYSATERGADDEISDRTNQRWLALRGPTAVWGSSTTAALPRLHGWALYLNVCRSPAYASFGLMKDRPDHLGHHQMRMDQGLHGYRFGFVARARFDEAALAARRPP